MIAAKTVRNYQNPYFDQIFSASSCQLLILVSSLDTFHAAGNSTLRNLRQMDAGKQAAAAARPSRFIISDGYGTLGQQKNGPRTPYMITEISHKAAAL